MCSVMSCKCCRYASATGGNWAAEANQDKPPAVILLLSDVSCQTSDRSSGDSYHGHRFHLNIEGGDVWSRCPPWGNSEHWTFKFLHSGGFFLCTNLHFFRLQWNAKLRQKVNAHGSNYILHDGFSGLVGRILCIPPIIYTSAFVIYLPYATKSANYAANNVYSPAPLLFIFSPCAHEL